MTSPEPASDSPAADESGSDDEHIGYAAALDELDAILRELERDDVDVDRLVDRVERAQRLIAVCRGRIEHAQMRVRDILGNSDDSDDAEHG